MRRAITFALVLVSAAAGALTGEFLSRMAAMHRQTGRLLGRGDLVAMVRRHGIFEHEQVADEVLRFTDTNAPINKDELDRAMFAVRGQFGDERALKTALHRNGMWRWQLRRMLADVLRGEEWIEEKIARGTSVSISEEQMYFNEHQTGFVQPPRIRARHIFLAAPQGSGLEEEKRAAIGEIMTRLENGEDFAALAAAVSEDEASKKRGGDLGFVASDRVPAEFWSAIQNLPVNGPVTLVQSHLGFHAVQILEVRPAREMTFEEARFEIEEILAEDKRRLAVAQLRDELEGKVVPVKR